MDEGSGLNFMKEFRAHVKEQTSKERTEKEMDENEKTEQTQETTSDSQLTTMERAEVYFIVLDYQKRLQKKIDAATYPQSVFLEQEMETVKQVLRKSEK